MSEKYNKNQNQKFPKGLELLTLLQQLGLTEHPLIAFQVKLAYQTGDTKDLERFMETNSWLIEEAMQSAMVANTIATQNPFYPFPIPEELATIQGPLALGIVNELFGQDIFFTLNPNLLTMHCMVLGRTGSGKSWFNAFMLEQLCRLSLHLGFNTIVPDIKGFYRRMLGIIPDLKVLLFDNFIFNPLQPPDGFGITPEQHIKIFASTFVRDNMLSLPSENLISETLTNLYRKRGIFDGSISYPTIRELHAYVKGIIKNKGLSLSWSDTTIKSLENRLSSYADIPNLNQRLSINPEIFSTENLVLELPLSRVTSHQHNFLVSLVANLIFHRNMICHYRGTTLNTLFLVDEAETLLAAGKDNTWEDPSITDIIRQGREFGIGLWLCAHAPWNFNRDFKSNTILQVCFALSDGEDIKKIGQSFGLSQEQIDYFRLRLQGTQAIAKYGPFPRPFLLEIPFLQGYDRTPTDSEVRALMQNFYDSITPVQHMPEIKEERKEEKKSKDPGPQPPKSLEEVTGIQLLGIMKNNPFLMAKARQDLMQKINKVSKEKTEKAETWLCENGYAVLHQIKIKRRGKPGTYLELTNKAYQSLNGKPPKGRGGFAHKLFCHTVKDLLEQKGMIAELEFVLDCKDGQQTHADVVGFKNKLPVELYEVTLDFSNLEEKVTKAIQTTAEKLIFVFSDDKARDKAKDLLLSKLFLIEPRLFLKTIFDITSK